MEIDDPNKPEFASWESYNRFARRVRHSRRFVWTDAEEAFLATVTPGLQRSMPLAM